MTEKVGRGNIPIGPVMHPLIISRSEGWIKFSKELASNHKYRATNKNPNNVSFTVPSFRWQELLLSILAPFNRRKLMAASSRTGSSRLNDAESDRGRVSEKITFHYFPNCHFHYRPTYFSPTFFSSRSCQHHYHCRRRRRTEKAKSSRNRKTTSTRKTKDFCFFFKLRGRREEFKALATIRVNELGKENQLC